MPRRLEHDWHDGVIPDNVIIDPEGYVETSQSFDRYRSLAEHGVTVGKGAAVYPPTMFDVGPGGTVRIGDFSMLNGPRIICDAAIEIGDYCLISWNVVLMDTNRVPIEPMARRVELERVSRLSMPHRLLDADPTPHPIRIGSNVWIGFDAVILPGITIGEGSVVGCRSVVAADVPPYTIVAGNPARIVKRLDR